MAWVIPSVPKISPNMKKTIPKTAVIAILNMRGPVWMIRNIDHP